MGASAREAALEVLERCRRDNAWSGASIDSTIRRHSLEGREAALASRLCLGVLQNSAYCDYYIDFFHKGGSKNLQPGIRSILRLGAYQILFLDKIPVHAAVDECVNLCRKHKYDRASGLVNAILRRIAEHREDLPPIPGAGSAEYLSIRYSHPLWLVRRLIQEQGYAFTEAFLAANNTPPELSLQVNTLKVEASAYARALERAEIPFHAVPELPGCLLLEGGGITSLPGYEEGLFYIQDRAARTAVAAAAPRPGMHVLDACAAPGGKSFSAALQMKNRGSILACDIHEKKNARIRDGAAKLGITILEGEAHDARNPWPGRTDSFDLVIADVPCSGLGVIRKRPEIRFKEESSLASLPAVQAAILNNLADYVRPGGTLMYSTCTILRAENEEVVEGFLANHSDYVREDFSAGGICSREGMYTFWPHREGTDGFFAAKLRRKTNLE